MAGVVAIPVQAALAGSDADTESTRARSAATTALQPFSDSSYFNTPVKGWPKEPSTKILMKDLYQNQSGPYHYLRMPGASHTGGWERPVYFGTAADPTYKVVCTMYCNYAPASIKLPHGADVPSNSDAAMVVANLAEDGVEANAWYAFWQTRIDHSTNTIRVSGGDTYIDSSGAIAAAWKCCGSVSANGGHRGFPMANSAIRWEEIESGRIRHALAFYIERTADKYCFPMTGDENSTGLIPEGARIRLRAWVNIDARVPNPKARIIARALQEYGAVITDQNGTQAATGLENLPVEGDLRPPGAPKSWVGVIGPDDLKSLPFTPRFWVFKKLGYEPSSGTVKGCSS
jgi:hypothetical protein